MRIGNETSEAYVIGKADFFLQFDQKAPLTRLVGAKHVFSFDLKSATDRWPLIFMFEVVQACFGREFASSVAIHPLLRSDLDVGRGRLPELTILEMLTPTRL